MIGINILQVQFTQENIAVHMWNHLESNNQVINLSDFCSPEQLIYEDIRDMNQVQDIAQLDLLASLLSDQSRQVIRYSTLAKQLGVSVDTVRRLKYRRRRF